MLPFSGFFRPKAPKMGRHALIGAIARSPFFQHSGLYAEIAAISLKTAKKDLFPQKSNIGAWFIARCVKKGAKALDMLCSFGM